MENVSGGVWWWTRNSSSLSLIKAYDYLQSIPRSFRQLQAIVTQKDAL
jgi:hypothetical protein